MCTFQPEQSAIFPKSFVKVEEKWDFLHYKNLSPNELTPFKLKTILLFGNIDQNQMQSATF